MSRGKFHIFMNRLAKNSAVARTSISQLSHLLLTLYSSLRTTGPVEPGVPGWPPAITLGNESMKLVTKHPLHNRQTEKERKWAFLPPTGLARLLAWTIKWLIVSPAIEYFQYFPYQKISFSWILLQFLESLFYIPNHGLLLIFPPKLFDLPPVLRISSQSWVIILSKYLAYCKSWAIKKVSREYSWKSRSCSHICTVN